MNRCQKCRSKKKLNINSKRINKDGSFSFYYICRKCNAERTLKYYYKNKEKVMKKRKENPLFKKRVIFHSRQWAKRNPDKVKEYARKIDNQKYHSNPFYRKAVGVRHSIGAVFRKDNKTAGTWERLTGYTTEQLKKHFESKFINGMSWDNYGKGGWEIDHIISQHKFNVSSLKECFDINNLQPLWAVDNKKKYLQEIML